jgi:hypothetical protein
MRLKRSNAGARVCALVSFVVLLVMALAATPALALPEGRHYEQVSPPYKGGYGAGARSAVAPDGESVAFVSLGAFAGTLLNGPLGSSYIARRSSAGWSTTSLMPPSALVPIGYTADYSSTLGYTLFKGFPGPNAMVEFRENLLLRHGTDTPDTEENWELAGTVLKSVHEEPLNVSYPGATADLCHILLDESGNDPLLPEAEGASPQLYEMLRGCDGEPPSLRLVSLNNAGSIIEPDCEPTLGGDISHGGRKFNAISADGNEIFFTVNVNPSEECENDHETRQLFVRLDGARTLEVSAPMSVAKSCDEVPCPNAEKRAPVSFEGANEAGTVVFFATTGPLEPATDTDSGNDLYMAKIGCPGGEAEECEVAQRRVTVLVQVSKGTEPAEVQRVVRLAPDGSRVYFVARGMLTSEGPQNTEADGAQAQPVKGADNLYVYERDERYPAGHIGFVADLCSGPELSGEVGDQRCPPDEGIVGERDDLRLWSSAEPEAQSTADGGVLVFSSYGQLLANDMDNAKDVYRYDAATGMIERVSLGERGHDANGNGEDSVSKPTFADASIETYLGGNDRVYEQHEMRTRAVSEDGSRIVFETSDPLSSAATNHMANVYEWHDGSVSLISSGNSLTNDCCAVISPSGRDVFFTTSQRLVPQDTDSVTDIYDARQGSDFTEPPAEREPCKGDACYGPLTNPAPLLVPGSIPQAPGGNFAAPKKAAPKKLTRAQQLARALKACAKKPKSKRAACRRDAHKKYAKAAKSTGRGQR